MAICGCSTKSDNPVSLDIGTLSSVTSGSTHTLPSKRSVRVLPTTSKL
jgi:hypothetical protein